MFKSLLMTSSALQLLKVILSEAYTNNSIPLSSMKINFGFQKKLDSLSCHYSIMQCLPTFLGAHLST